MSLKIIDLGLIDFKKAWDLQKDVFSAVRRGDYHFALILCRHLPVFTLGRRANKANILAQKDIPSYEIERGGDVTYHGPGQLTAYPIFDLHYFKKDLNFFLRYLEQVVIDLLGDFGIKGERLNGLTGVWVKEGEAWSKIASIGISVKNWITFHGVSINIKKDDLVNFSLIRPCGMDIKMTSLESLLERDIEIDSLKDNLINKFKLEEVFHGQSSLAGIR
jgi:lipoyl(octanoyl) transferase